MKRLSVTNPIYDIVFTDCFDNMGEFGKLGISTSKAMAVFDSNTERFWKSEVMDELSKIYDEVCSFTFPAGEQSKNLDTVEDLYEALIKNHFERKDVLIAVGGGVCGDMTGFVAATYLRGVKFFQVPTTLLAMCDSSVGGKTGVDFRSYKNMVGAFHHPSYVYMNMSTLKTLPDREFLSGMGEVIKYGYIREVSLLDYICENAKKIKERDFESLTYIVEHSCRIKKEVVENDPMEKGLRAILNYGHTIGHAIEKLMNFKLLHGECVALGMIAAMKISVDRGVIEVEELDRLKKINTLFGLPVSVSGISAEEILKVSKSDKKMSAGKIRFILLNKVGDGYIDDSVTDEELIKGINEVLNEQGN